MEMNSAAEHRSSGVFHHGYRRSLERSVVIMPPDLELHMASSPAQWEAHFWFMKLKKKSGVNRKQVIIQCQVDTRNRDLDQKRLLFFFFSNKEVGKWHSEWLRVTLCIVIWVSLCVCLPVCKAWALIHTFTDVCVCVCMTGITQEKTSLAWGGGDGGRGRRWRWLGKSLSRSSGQESSPALAVISPGWKPSLWGKGTLLTPTSCLPLVSKQGERMDAFRRVHNRATMLWLRYAFVDTCRVCFQENHRESVHSSPLRRVFPLLRLCKNVTQAFSGRQANLSVIGLQLISIPSYLRVACSRL